MSVQDGPAATASPMTGAEWDAQLETRIAMAIRRFMAEYPAPDDSALAADAARSAENLLLDGRARLQGAGVRPLRLVQARALH